MTAVLEVPTALLPAEAYWSPSWFAAEQERLFARTWNLVGTEDDLAGGRALVATVAGSTVVVEGTGGHLVARQRSAPAAVDTWAGYVFVHLDPSGAPPLAQWLGDFPDRIGGFRPDRLVEVARHRFELAANWKFFVENHIDVYHLWYLHERSLGAYDHARASWSTTGPHWVFYEPPRSGVDIHGEGFWRGLRPVHGIVEERWGSGAHLIWPNVTLATGAGFFMTYQCTPLGPARSLVDLRVRTEPGSDATEMVAMSRAVIEAEDGGVCERLQAGVRSPWFRVGPLARRHERPIVWFHERVLDTMELG
ncbi:MAG TPA: RHO alpha subunit C-terminal catalytic domain-containing protein [Acidimicrobiales bacterium]